MDSIIPVASLSCKESFTVSHNLNSPYLSNTANKQVYGVCNNSTEHKHEYNIKVTTRGAVDSSIGTVMSLSDLRSDLMKAIIGKLNGKNLNAEIEFFKTVPTTMENLAVYIWKTMKTIMASPELLYEVKLTDNHQNCVVYNGSGGYLQRKGQSFLTSDTD